MKREGRALSILYAAYPLLAVSGDSAGGAEQMLLTLEREMLAKGHRTTVAAADGSQVGGRLLPTGPAATGPDQYDRREREHVARIVDYLRRNPAEFDLIHDCGGSFARVATGSATPVLATLHLPRELYRQQSFHSFPPNLYFNCVSQSQKRLFEDLPNMLGVVQNGVPVDRFPSPLPKENFLLWLGRICEEKAPHVAIAVARQAGVPLVLGGQVYPFSYHQQYFDREIRPYLREGSTVRFINAPSNRQKLELLRRAKTVLLTSTIAESSSLVAMEAMACGAAVVAFRRGAFPEVVADGKTGFLVDSPDEMIAALTRVDRISPAACRARVERKFTAKRMAQEYEGLYRQGLAASARRAA